MCLVQATRRLPEEVDHPLRGLRLEFTDAEVAVSPGGTWEATVPTAAMRLRGAFATDDLLVLTGLVLGL